MNYTNKNHRDPFRLPHLGQRITKTTIAVFLCLLIYWLRGYHGQDMPTESAITAIICMQPYVQDSRDYALNRATGTLIGVLWGLLLLYLLYICPGLGANLLCLYAIMAAGVLLSLYSTVLVRRPDASSLAAIVFLCIVISFPDIDEPLLQAGRRMLDVFIGTAVAITVNVFRLPRRKKRELLFFVRTKDLVPDRFSHIPPAALYQLNYLYNDGARICLMSEHAPAFFVLQMGGAHLNTPMIVMDGAAIFDPNENTFLSVETLAPEDSVSLQAWLDGMGISYFIYTIHHDKTCIFHHGTVRAEESIIYERMRRSPYRSYLEGEIYEPKEIVYFKIIAAEGSIGKLEHHLRDVIPKERMRSAIRAQAGAPGICALYVYSHAATMEQAQKRLMIELWKTDPDLVPTPILSRDGYRSERDAIHLLHQVERRYEPLCITHNSR